MRFATVTSALADRGRRFDINDDRVIEIDKVVGRVGEEGEASIRGAPAGGRICRGDELRHDRCGSAECGIIEDSEILLCRAVYGVRR